MIVFPCPHCQYEIRADANQGGRELRCGRCGRPATVPAPGAATTGGGPRAAGKSTGHDDPPERTEIPPEDTGERTVAAPDLHAQDTLAQAPARTPGGPGSELYDFLAPPQKPDEIGRLGPYRVLRVLGSGGMGVVFLAEDLHLERPVALKAMKPVLAVSEAAKKRFLREAKAMALLKHDHIVTIHHVGEDRGTPYLAMEFLEGELLDDRLKRERKLPVAEVLRIGRETAEGLAAAHARGLIHRDIKPGNIFLEGPRGRVKILDFGLARAAVDDAHITQSGVILGTPAFMAPEQARGEPVDARCDLFSLGCVLYRMCTGAAPFNASDAISTLVAVTVDEPRPPGQLAAVPPELSEFIMRLLAKKREDRPASAAGVAETLGRMEAAVTARPAVWNVFRRWRRQRPAPAPSPSTEIVPTEKPAARTKAERPTGSWRWWKVVAVAAVVWVGIVITHMSRQPGPNRGTNPRQSAPSVRKEKRGAQSPPGTKVIPGDRTWDIEKDQLSGGDLQWSPALVGGGKLTPINGAQAAVVPARSWFFGRATTFNNISPALLRSLKYSKDPIDPGHLKPGSLLAVRTAEGHYAKLKVARYFPMHDFDFPGARDVLSPEWIAKARQLPSAEQYHLEVEWVLYRTP
jgi:serine/threonine protein kinase